MSFVGCFLCTFNNYYYYNKMQFPIYICICMYMCVERMFCLSILVLNYLNEILVQNDILSSQMFYSVEVIDFILFDIVNVAQSG